MHRSDLEFSINGQNLFCKLQHQASNSKKVYLKSLTLKSTGTYRCEISAEEPDFKTVTDERKLEVICKYFSFFSFSSHSTISLIIAAVEK